MIDYQMMSRFVRGFASLMHADKADGGQDPRLLRGGRHRHRPARRSGDRRRRRQDRLPADGCGGVPAAGAVGAPPRRPAKRLLLTGDCITGAQAADGDWPWRRLDPADLDERTERLVERIAAVPVNQLIMVKLAMEHRALPAGCGDQPNGQHGVRRDRPAHPGGTPSSPTPANTAFREAVRQRDEPFGDHGRTTSGV